MTPATQHSYDSPVMGGRTAVCWVALTAVTALGSAACGGGTEEPETSGGAIDARDERRAERLLERARESGEEADFRKVLNRFAHTKAAEEAKLDLARLLAARAEKQLAAGDLTSAETDAEEAKRLGDLATTEKARAVLDQIDDTRSETTSKEANQLAEGGRCASAAKKLAESLPKSRPRFQKGVRKATVEPLVACLEKKFQTEIDAGNVDAARQTLDSADVTAALGKKGYEVASRRLEKAIVRASTKAIQPLLKAANWKEAIAAIDEMKSKNELSKAEHAVAFSIIQDAMLEHLIALATDAFDAKKPSEKVAEIAKTEELAQWKKRPAKLAELLDLLKMATECERLRCRMHAPKKRYAWGAIAVHPRGEAEGSETGKVKHAEEVWVVGTAKSHVLVAEKDPEGAKGADLARAVSGWIDPDRLKTADTDDWLPPVDQLAGVEVWGPLRKPKPEYHFGRVEKVDGDQATVTVLADSTDVTVPVSSLRLGRFPKGLKVMAFCIDQLHPEPAKVEKVVTRSGGIPKVKVICEKGEKERVEVATSLTTTARWLPARKPPR